MRMRLWTVINGIGGNTKGSAITITLPFAALVQDLSSPQSPGTRKYILIWQAANIDQYVVGRTFLQETYLILDCERQKFFLHQANFPYPLNEDLVALDAPFSKKSIGAIAGNTGASLLLLLIALYSIQRVKQRRRREAGKSEAQEEAARVKIKELDVSFTALPAGPISIAVNTMEIDSETVLEIGGMPRYVVQEMGVPATPIHGELPGSEYSE